jgi:hypothetical protein
MEVYKVDCMFRKWQIKTESGLYFHKKLHSDKMNLFGLQIGDKTTGYGPI